MNFERFRNDVVHGIAPSLRYGVIRDESPDVVSVTAVSNQESIDEKIATAFRDNPYFRFLVRGDQGMEGDLCIPFAYVLDLTRIAKQQNVKCVKQGWIADELGPHYQGLEAYVETPGVGLDWEGEVRISFNDFIHERCIDLSACDGVLLQEQHVPDVKNWAYTIRQESLFVPTVPILRSRDAEFLGVL
ncbi:MAG: hypothetical protein RLZZ455_983 [Candidatus Parcubacteria bacterium]